MSNLLQLVSNRGVAMPVPIYGTAWKKERTEALVTLALKQGFRSIDTACQPKHYFEPGVGAAVAAAIAGGLTREDLYLQTKFTQVRGHDPQQIPFDASAPLEDQVAESFRVSLRNLRTSYVDGLVLHSPLDRVKETLKAWRAMETIVDAGGARQIGISNCYELAVLQQLQRDARIKPSIVQNRFYAETSYDREIRAFCANHDIVYQSFWTLTANPQLLGHESLVAIAQKLSRTPAQVLFRFLAQNAVAPLTGTKSEVHMREALQIAEFELTPTQVAAIEVLL